jgi:hypothetical protein
VRRIIEQGLGPKLRPMITFIGRREVKRENSEMELNRFSQNAREAVEVAQSIVRRGQGNQLGTEHHTKPTVTARRYCVNQDRKQSGRQRDESANGAGTNRAVNSRSIGETVVTQDGSITEGRP